MPNPGNKEGEEEDERETAKWKDEARRYLRVKRGISVEGEVEMGKSKEEGEEGEEGRMKRNRKVRGGGGRDVPV